MTFPIEYFEVIFNLNQLSSVKFGIKIEIAKNVELTQFADSTSFIYTGKQNTTRHLETLITQTFDKDQTYLEDKCSM